MIYRRIPQIFIFFKKFDNRLYKSTVNNPTAVVLMRLNKRIASQNAENASFTLIPKICPPIKNAYVGNTKNRLTSNPMPVAITQPQSNVIITVFKFLRY